MEMKYQMTISADVMSAINMALADRRYKLADWLKSQPGKSPYCERELAALEQAQEALNSAQSTEE
ncbi:hypothetical protein B1748_29220 [Paenibacillus sp. MY03]|nr:hypothetical protein [Paenibacillus sp. MY03]OUS67622.1 hypothetical protein B1748_36105 [Paenibacillus sp. MY03]OUS70318.1 hypothetical protein B1748_29220 [Paenibacillus sp. MY03]